MEPVVPYQQLNVVLSERESLVVIQPHVAGGESGGTVLLAVLVDTPCAQLALLNSHGSAASSDAM